MKKLPKDAAENISLSDRRNRNCRAFITGTKEDLPLLIEHNVGTLSAKTRQFPRASAQTIMPAELVQSLYKYSCPEMFVSFRCGAAVPGDHDLAAILRQIAPSGSPISLPQMKEGFRGEQHFGESLTDALAHLEKQMILQTLAQTGNNTKLAAEQLKIPLHTLYRRMKKYHIPL